MALDDAVELLKIKRGEVQGSAGIRPRRPSAGPSDVMCCEQPRPSRPRVRGTCALAAALLMAPLAPAMAQDIRGLEICTAERQMDRRTACLQANVEFLQQELSKLDRETDAKVAAATRDLATTRAEIATLKATIEKLGSELTQMKAKADPHTKK